MNIFDLANFKKIFRKLYIMTALLVFAGMCLTGCGETTIEEGSKYLIYYLSNDNKGLVSYEINIDQEDLDTTANILMDLLLSPVEPENFNSVIENSDSFNSLSTGEGQIFIDFNPQIYQEPSYMNALMRAALTKTLTQIDGVTAVSCTVDGLPMMDSAGIAIGPMTPEQFIENEGAQINPDEQTMLTLYFSTEDGNNLISVNRKVTYSSNISMDKLVVEQILAGPAEKENGYPVINPSTKIISVTTQDGTCYVNLSNDFLTTVNNVSTDVAIYSIVDSLIEIGNINKVQFLIDGESDIMFRESVNLSTPFVRNLDLIE